MNEIGALSKALEAAAEAAESQTEQKEGGAGPEMREFALLLTTMLQAKSSISPSPGASGKDGAGGLGLDSGLMSMLTLALSNGEALDPDLLATLLASMTGASPARGAGLTTSLSADSRLNAYASKSPAPGSASTAKGLDYRGSEAVPYDAWVAVSPKIQGSEGNRSAKLLNDVIAQFNVETNGRYRQNKYGNDTYCNIFVWDVSRALGVEIPHYVDAKTGEPRYYPNVQGAYELDANGVADWLAQNGAKYGWREVSAQDAQGYANRGLPAVTAWKNAGGIGHVQVVCPSKSGDYDPSRGVTVAQAGRVNTQYAYISSTYSSSRLPSVKYYVHA